MSDKYIKLSQALEVLDVCSCWWAHERMECIPDADVVPVVWGKWEHDGFNWFCNRCNYNALCDKDTGEEVLSPRCPNCGARMNLTYKFPMGSTYTCKNTQEDDT